MVEKLDLIDISSLIANPKQVYDRQCGFKVADYQSYEEDGSVPIGCERYDNDRAECIIYDADDVIAMDKNGNGDGKLTFDEYVKFEKNRYSVCKISDKLCSTPRVMGIFQDHFNRIAEGVAKFKTNLKK